MTISIDHGELIAAAGSLDAVAAELDDGDVEILRHPWVDSGSEELDSAVYWFNASWLSGVTSLVVEQARLASGLRDTVTDFLGVDADVAYAHAVLRRGLDLQ